VIGPLGVDDDDELELDELEPQPVAATTIPTASAAARYERIFPYMWDAPPGQPEESGSRSGFA
jgi:hypothetical protein